MKMTQRGSAAKSTMPPVKVASLSVAMATPSTAKVKTLPFTVRS